MYGWRARIGKISPSRSDSFTYEFYKIAPEGIVLVLSGFTIFELVGNDIERAHQRIEESAKDLAKVGVDFIITGGTPIFTYKGKGSDQAVIERIKELNFADIELYNIASNIFYERIKEDEEKILSWFTEFERHQRVFRMYSWIYGIGGSLRRRLVAPERYTDAFRTGG